jgi:predicted dehydrogenase
METRTQRQFDRPIRLGLIGCGGIVQHAHLPALLTIPELAQVVAVADPIPENLAQVGNAAGVPDNQRYENYRAMLEQANLDAVSIATPHHLHAEHAIHSAEAGIAVICEKPMATSLEEAHAILEAVHRCRVKYSVVHNYLFTPAMRLALSLLREVQMGEPVYGRAQSLYKKAEDLPSDKWRHNRQTGGGALNDTAYHEIYLIEALMKSPVRYVEARIQAKFYHFDVDDLALLLLEHENGAVSTLSTGWFVPEPDIAAYCEVHTAAGSLRVRHRGRSLQRYLRSDQNWEEIAVSPLSPEEQRWVGHAGFFKATFEALLQGEELPVTGEQALHNIAVIDAARRASHERRAVALD